MSKTYKYDDSVDAGKVVSQSPRGGNAQEGSTVTIVISQGKKSSTVPSVQGHSKKDAQAALQKAGLKVAVKEEYSDSVKAGQVISQSVASGKDCTGRYNGNDYGKQGTGRDKLQL